MMIKSDIDQVFGSKADDIDQFVEVHHENDQWHFALEALTDEESQAWRKLVKLWVLLVTGRNRAPLKAITAPQRCKLEDLSAMIEKWESTVRASTRNCKTRKASNSNSLKI